MWDIAPMFNALLLFAEHRFYGETQPFGNKSYSSLENLGYLSTEQALADYAVFLRWFKSVNYTLAENSPVIAFGGSYGGMLAAWMRIKYPNVIDGSLAASAPILQFNNVTPCWSFSSIVTRTFSSYGETCSQCIRNSWQAIKNMTTTAGGRTQLAEIFHLCLVSKNHLIASKIEASAIIQWLSSIYGNLAMGDYPYPTDFLTPGYMPAWPVKVSCSYLTDPAASDDMLLSSIYQAISIFVNSTNDLPCITVPTNFSDVRDNLGWPFQTCTEMVMPMCNNGTDMFDVKAWNFTEFSDICYAVAKVRPRLNWATTEYGADKLQAASKIIFSNGNLDPWSGGGVLNPIPGADTLIPIYINNSAHHYDLRGANDQDTDDVIKARQREIEIIKGWVNYQTPPNNSNRNGVNVAFLIATLLYSYMYL